MDTINWKSITKDNFNQLIDKPEAYAHALVMFSEWNKIAELLMSDLSHFALIALKKAKSQREFLKTLTEEKALELMDKGTQEIQRELLVLLIKNYDQLPLSQSIGKTLLVHIDQHSWAYQYSKEILSLQSNDDLKIAFSARISDKKKNKEIPELWSYLINPKYHYSKTKPGKIYTYLNINYFVSQRILFYRKSFAKLISEVLVAALNGYDVNDQNEKSIRDEVSKALLNFPYEKVEQFKLFDILLSNKLDDKEFKLHRFVRFKVITTKQILDVIFPRCFKVLIESEPHSFRFDALTNNYIKMFSSLPKRAINFLNTLKYLSINEKEHPLSNIWTSLMNRLEYVTIQNYRIGKFQLLKTLIKYMTKGNDTLSSYSSIPMDCVSVSYKLILNIVINTIRNIIDHKQEIVQGSPEFYSTMLHNIMKGLLNERHWGTKETFSIDTYKDPFYMLTPELRDELLTEYMSDPTGKKQYNHELAKCITTVPIGLSLLFTDLKKLANAIKGDNNKCDEYGFLDSTVNFPPLINQETRNSEAIQASIHVIEKLLIPYFRNKDERIAIKAFSLYSLFVRKLAFTAIKLDKAEIYKKSSEAYFRLCRFLLSKYVSQVQDANIDTFVTTILYPAYIYVGFKSNDKFINVLQENILSKMPYSHSKFSVLPMTLFEYLLKCSYSIHFPGIDKVYKELIPILFKQLNMDLSKSFTYKTNSSITPNYNLYEMISEDRFKSLIKLSDEQSKLLIPEKFSRIALSDPFSSKLNIECKGQCINTNVYTRELIKTTEVPQISTSTTVIKEILSILNQKVNDYDPLLLNHISTKLLTSMIDLIKKINFYPTVEQTLRLPLENDFPYETTNSLATYKKNLAQLSYELKISKSTILFTRTLMGEDSFIRRFFDGEDDECIKTFEMLDKVLKFRPYNVNEAKELKNYPVKEYFSFVLKASYYIPLSIYCRLKNNDERYLEPRKVKPGYNTIRKRKSNLKRRPFHEKWISSVTQRILEPLFKVNFEKACELIKEDGEGLKYIILLLSKYIKNWKEFNYSSDLFSHFYNLLIKDFLIEDPKPTKENPNPKPTPTLFYKANGQTVGVIQTMNKKKSYKASSNTGLNYYVSTKILLGYLSRILTNNPVILNNMNINIFEESLMKFLSLSPDTLKVKIGDDNIDHFGSYFCQVICLLIPFNDLEITSNDWILNEKNIVYKIFFKLFTCDVFNYECLEIINKLLQSLTQQSKKDTILKSFISALVSLKDYSFTLHTRTRVSSWCLDPQYCGNPIPQYCLDYINYIIQDPKLHIDLRRTIAASIIAYFKTQSIIKQKPTQTTELFNILKRIYETIPNLMGTVFCQLVKPKYCDTLTRQVSIFKELMPNASFPIHFITPPKFTTLSMPHKDEWEIYHQQYLTLFIGPSLLSQDDRICQLAIKILTKIGIEGGTLANQTSKFIENAFNGLNVRASSVYLINFGFDFCFNSCHKSYDKMYEAFISIFSKLRNAIEETNNNQVKYLWLKKSSNIKNNKFDYEVYKPLVKTCDAFSNNIDTVIMNLKSKEDCLFAQELGVKILDKLLNNYKPSINLNSYDTLCDHVKILCNDHLMKAIYLEPSEDSLIEYLEFVKENVKTTFIKCNVQQILQKLFNKNKYQMNANVVRKMVDWDSEIATSQYVKNWVNPLIYEMFRDKDENDKDVVELTPLLASFSFVE
ncbi:hypothetical protein GPJ56_003517 [Histomonas meleagridis]|uniref:uncharacterized protein n=1 Tax=Histomonas meleagridis TaxID=135588 RepID=UPI00355997C3|nr:hypothetical protein GPJ56_003517 [Histomonas meleagridis]KAH0806403.1 hypothetical protein GO595_000778 [Histomonas meleagridis]